MTALPPDQRKRLAKLCGMLGSNNPNEQVNAADLATKLIRDHGLTWEQIIMGADRESPDFVEIRRRSEPYTPPPQRPRQPDVRSMIRQCEAWSADLTGWEVEFLASVKRRREPLTDNQLSALYRIHDRVSRWQSAWGTAS